MDHDDDFDYGNHTALTDALAAKIMRAKGRGTAGTFSDLGRQARASMIDGMAEAWEFMTNVTGSEENLAKAAQRDADKAAEQEARENAEGIRATDCVTVGKGKGEWVVQHVDVRTALLLSPTGRRTQRADLTDLTLVRKGSRHTDFYRG